MKPSRTGVTSDIVEDLASGKVDREGGPYNSRNNTATKLSRDG